MISDATNYNGDQRKGTRAAAATSFSEAGAWRDVGAGWQPIFGSFRGGGYSIEWHDFRPKHEFDWAASFHPGCVELCLNLAGHGFVEGRGGKTEFTPNTAGFYHRTNEPLTAKRAAGELHQFLTVEFSGPFLARHLAETKAMLHPVVRAAVEGCPCELVTGATVRLTAAQQQLIATLRQPPVYAAAQSVWYQCKALELAVTFLVKPEEELFCTRQQRMAQERVEQVVFLLNQNLAAPPTLEELGRKIGCSHFYLSRIFSNHTGRTISQHHAAIAHGAGGEIVAGGRAQCHRSGAGGGLQQPQPLQRRLSRSVRLLPRVVSASDSNPAQGVAARPMILAADSGFAVLPTAKFLHNRNLRQLPTKRLQRLCVT